VPGGRSRVRLGEFDFLVSGAGPAAGEARVTIRPERVLLEPGDAPGENRIPAVVERLIYGGASSRLVLRLAHDATLEALVANNGASLPYRQGSAVTAHLPPDALRVLVPSSANERPDLGPRT